MIESTQIIYENKEQEIWVQRHRLGLEHFISIVCPKGHKPVAYLDGNLTPLVDESGDGDFYESKALPGKWRIEVCGQQVFFEIEEDNTYYAAS